MQTGQDMPDMARNGGSAPVVTQPLAVAGQHHERLGALWVQGQRGQQVGRGVERGVIGRVQLRVCCQSPRQHLCLILPHTESEHLIWQVASRSHLFQLPRAGQTHDVLCQSQHPVLHPNSSACAECRHSAQPMHPPGFCTAVDHSRVAQLLMHLKLTDERFMSILAAAIIS